MRFYFLKITIFMINLNRKFHCAETVLIHFQSSKVKYSAEIFS